MVRKTIKMIILILFMVLLIFSIVLLIKATKLSDWKQISEICKALIVTIIAIDRLIVSYSEVKQIKGTDNIFKGLLK